MRLCKWPFVFLLVMLGFACSSLVSQHEVRLTIDSEPPNAKIYEEGKFLGTAPVNVTYKYESQIFQYFIPMEYGDYSGIKPLLQPRSFTAMKDGFEPQTKPFTFFTNKKYRLGDEGIPYQRGHLVWNGRPEFFEPMDFSLHLLLEPQGAKPQQQQQQQQQQTVVVIPGAGGAAKAYGSLTILSTPSPAEVYVDGTFVATTPVSSLQIEVGPHKVEIQKGGYKTWTRTMQVLPNSPVKIEVELDKI
ncbi:MAG: PEGA domain-containing protein [Acidobacteriota bacterium]|nr:PEGA domain-containing protein [Acidobacteriota bacterium]